MAAFVPQTDDPAQKGLMNIRNPDPPVAHAPAKAPRCLISIVLAFGIVACVRLGISGLATFANLFLTEKPRVEQALDLFMSEMSARDLEAAYNLFSSRVQKPNLASALQESAKGNNYALFRGYLRLELTELTFELRGTTDPVEPQGLVATTSGIVTYSDGFSGRMDAVLEKEQNDWRIYAFQVNVPPSKIGNGRQPAASRNFIDTKDAECYTVGTGSPLAHRWDFSAGWSTPADQAGRPVSFAERLIVGLSPARMAFFPRSPERRTTDGLQGEPAPSSIVHARVCDHSDSRKRIANVASLPLAKCDLGIGPRS